MRKQTIRAFGDTFCSSESKSQLCHVCFLVFWCADYRCKRKLSTAAFFFLLLAGLKTEFNRGLLFFFIIAQLFLRSVRAVSKYRRNRTDNKKKRMTEIEELPHPLKFYCHYYCSVEEGGIYHTNMLFWKKNRNIKEYH